MISTPQPTNHSWLRFANSDRSGSRWWFIYNVRRIVLLLCVIAVELKYLPSPRIWKHRNRSSHSTISSRHQLMPHHRRWETLLPSLSTLQCELSWTCVCQSDLQVEYVWMSVAQFTRYARKNILITNLSTRRHPIYSLHCAYRRDKQLSRNYLTTTATPQIAVESAWALTCPSLVTVSYLENSICLNFKRFVLFRLRRKIFLFLFL
jgi:hypothetical protein